MDPSRYGGAAVAADVVRPSKFQSFARRAPAFGYVLMFYLLTSAFTTAIGGLTWYSAVTWGNYSVSLSDVFTIMIVAALLTEAGRVSWPGKNNSVEVSRMYVVAGIVTAMFAIGVMLNFLTGAGMLAEGLAFGLFDWLSEVFSNTQFLLLLIFNWMAIPTMNLINGRTAQRGMAVGDTSGDDFGIDG
ncbi:hypothetical protein KC906_04165 [Candidatus Kaiserbacteria bacterium]|nr:hypothetical protein [Candidatus Kaiserbacteria bacterium]MCB9812257.1 hypothetical protein [Candidatus Nomurabacteria bacterium]